MKISGRIAARSLPRIFHCVGNLLFYNCLIIGVPTATTLCFYCREFHVILFHGVTNQDALTCATQVGAFDQVNCLFFSSNPLI